MTLALLCSGQGPQHAGMFAVTGAAPPAEPLFARAAALLGGRDPRRFVAEAEHGEVHGNRAGQVLCTLQAGAALLAFPEIARAKRIALGYSIGEVSSWTVAGLVAPAASLDLAVERAAAMDAASAPGDGLLFVRGLDAARVEALCAAHGGAVAIVNPGDACVIGGAAEELRALEGAARAAGAGRVMRVGVAVASHTPRLAGAVRPFRAALARAEFADRVPPGARLFSTVDAAPVLRIADGLDKLAAQVAAPVRWADCLDAAVEAGATAFLELGPGRALAEMAGSARPDLPSRSLDDFRSADGVSLWLAQVRR